MPDSVAANTRPIELVTENGFTIVRSWEIDRVPPPLAGSYHFIVRNSQSLEREITVEFTDDVVVQIELSTRGRILQGHSFWFCCAERHLANHVWENDDCPRDGKLWVNRLDPDDLITAIRWRIA